MIRIVIADDHPIFRDGLRRLLQSEPGMSVLAEASDGNEAVTICAQHQPDILLLDLTMPRFPGMQTLREMSKAKSPVRIILLTAAIDRPQMVEALQLGARGIVLKESATEVLFRSIHEVMSGRHWVGREPVESLQAFLMKDLAETVSPKNSYGLTPREVEIVAAIVRGQSNKEIAATFSIREDTVKHHLTSIFGKVGVGTRLELALFALEHKLVSKFGLEHGVSAAKA
ncbi:MAG TPA: response regulator transcription factor [Terriglobales bacterium]|jgi:DNA-binding NarL/FixJ family response regulator|nr:response regulator transcription factor [Terriglobales bacterium]